MGRSLLDDEESGQAEDFTLKVNSKYAARLEVRGLLLCTRNWLCTPAACSLVQDFTGCAVLQHNKRREELHRLQEKHPDVAARLAAGGGESADSSSEDDEVRRCFLRTSSCLHYCLDQRPRSRPVFCAHSGRCCHQLPACRSQLANLQSAAPVGAHAGCSFVQDDGMALPQEEARFLDVLARLKQRDRELYASSAPLFPEDDVAGDGGAVEPDEHAAPRAKRQRVMSLATVNAQQARAARASCSSAAVCTVYGVMIVQLHSARPPVVT